MDEPGSDLLLGVDEETLISVTCCRADNWHVDEPGSDLLLGVDEERH